MDELAGGLSLDHEVLPRHQQPMLQLRPNSHTGLCSGLTACLQDGENPSSNWCCCQVHCWGQAVHLHSV